MLVQELMKGMMSMTGGAKKMAEKTTKALVPSNASSSEMFLTIFVLSIVNYLVRAFIFMIIINALMPRFKEINPQMREVSFGESVLFVILFSIIFS